jgi:hypothetical protein
MSNAEYGVRAERVLARRVANDAEYRVANDAGYRVANDAESRRIRTRE